MSCLKIFVKLVICSIHDNSLQILLKDETLLVNELKSTTNLENVVATMLHEILQNGEQDHYTEQLYSFSSETEITIAYYILIPEDLRKRVTSGWEAYDKVSKKNPDFEIISYAIQRLQWKIEYTNVVYSLLAQEFTLSELQSAYEAILGKKLDKRNFRKKILSLHFLEQTRKRKIALSRPAQMYRFKKREPVMVKIFS